MRRHKLSLLVAMCVACVCLVAAPAQTGRQFVDEGGKYKITLAAGWEPVTYTDAVGRRKTEFVYGVRSEGMLRVSRERLDRRPLADIIWKEMRDLRLCQPKVDVAGDEAFEGGMLAGRRVSFCYVEGGRWVAATYYFLEDLDAVWILRFTGRMGSLDTNRGETDLMARSFCPF